MAAANPDQDPVVSAASIPDAYSGQDTFFCTPFQEDAQLPEDQLVGVVVDADESPQEELQHWMEPEQQLQMLMEQLQRGQQVLEQANQAPHRSHHANDIPSLLQLDQFLQMPDYGSPERKRARVTPDNRQGRRDPREVPAALLTNDSASDISFTDSVAEEMDSER
ncbi:hypothetical protein GN956_G26514 [Arapaima gigas]